ncbi:MAG: formylglycine-generating enzyme family protein [Prevotellaceae bacterium]|nr:formylglycine-generating enzyme family protein [Prevotellaceae bacterium]
MKKITLLSLGLLAFGVAAQAQSEKQTVAMYVTGDIAGKTTEEMEEEKRAEEAKKRAPNNMVYVEGSATLSDFYIGKYEVTQAEWQAVMGSNPSNFKGANRPVEKVSWDDVQEFLRKLNAKTGGNFRLPTEAEWEYAAKGGPNRDSYEYAGSDMLGAVVSWYEDNLGNSPHPVGTRQPNSIGIYDMTGNVWELCQDCYDSSGCSYHVLRGGYCGNGESCCRVTYRGNYKPSNRHACFGFRLVCSSK